MCGITCKIDGTEHPPGEESPPIAPDDLNLISAEWLRTPEELDALLLIAFVGGHAAMRFGGVPQGSSAGIPTGAG